MLPIIEIVGSGVAGLCCAQAFVEKGCQVTLRSASNGIDESCCSWWAGGMLAPWCESESAEPLIFRLGQESLRYWQQHSQSMHSGGSLVLAHRRDQADIRQFAQRTTDYQELNRDQIGELEPDIDGRFDLGLHYPQEAHLNPRETLQALLDRLLASELFTAVFNERLDDQYLQSAPDGGWRIDCRGLAARDSLSDLRGVKGEMLILETAEITLSRPVRVLHPRHPIYIVPRSNDQFMVGATMIESDDRTHASARSVMELLSSAYALHPAFADAAIVQIGTDVRPAFTDNLPRLRRRGQLVYVNGLYRHGFLCAPAMAQRAVSLVLEGNIDEEVVDENHD
ncbi:FAD-dependent oxidoreductase [Granulosicoccus antarcticus]|uniref:D-amino-acid oxidase n=1 Tax=Granulosicoccus antarcticus IMCC3135 TaxID=1192854 RepID=A0A2Z2NRC1_9GAMM|nr:FAD-dependent oxidoreductase [Granulosicoccus antarcticus]ASJ74056.1 Glycine oxidase [Granulosicoccus antarcticus IMCC3135]